MIDIKHLTKCKKSINVKPSNQIFSELGKNTYDFKDLISELIDNSIAAKINDKILKVKIDIYVNQKGKAIDFVIKDNAKGIPDNNLGLAITPAGIQTINSLNEHGLGMKQAVAAMGKLKYLVTKTIDDDKARLIKEFKFGEVDTYLYDKFDYESGTEIAITNVNNIVISNPSHITQYLVPYLGARYRRFLKSENNIMELTINIINNLSNNTEYTWNVQEVKPIYFHPFKRKNKPVIFSYLISKKSKWKAKLTFGYAPKGKAEYEELGIEFPKRYQPYYVSLGKQGLDIIFQDRVILFHQLSELGIINVKHNDYNTIRGEVELIRGFSTAITKNSIINDENFKECIEQVKNILTGKIEGPNKEKKDYLKSKTYPEEIPEKLLRDRLVTWLENNPIAKKEDVEKEYAVEGIEGRIDIYADKEAWELKINQASALSVYQLFMYMDVGNIRKGYLVAKDFTTGANVAVKYIKEKHDKEIILSKLQDFPINQPPTEEERNEYYN